MHKKFLFIVLPAIVFAAGYMIHITQKPVVDLSKIGMENVGAIASDENDGGGESEPTEKLYWSDPIDCPGWFTGDYCICQDNGGGNSCSKAGDKTCDCGRNC